MTINERMERAADKGLRVKVVDVRGIVYEGAASHFCKADDEEDGYATVCIFTDDKGGWCLGENEIASIAFMEE